VPPLKNAATIILQHQPPTLPRFKNRLLNPLFQEFDFVTKNKNKKLNGQLFFLSAANINYNLRLMRLISIKLCHEVALYEYGL